MKYLPKVAFLLCFIIATAFSIKSLREPDLWWQIKTGEWILDNFQVPVKDVFSYTYKDAPWINIKWGFEVLAATVSQTVGADCVYLLQVIVSVLLVWFLYKLSLLFRENHKIDKKTFYTAFALVIPFLLVGVEYRIIGRPEMLSHLFTVIFLYLLLAYRFNASKWVYTIIPLQCIWANFHEAFGIGIVLISLFFVAGIVEWKLLKLKQKGFEQVKIYGFTLLLSVGVLLLNPYGYKLLLQPLEIFGQVFENKFTTELLSISSRDYWKKEAWIAIAFLALAVFTVARLFFAGKRKASVVVEQLPVGYLLTIAAFIYLATSAYRNIIFLDLMVFPLLVWQLYDFIVMRDKLKPVLSVFAVVLSLGLYIAVVSNKYYEFTKSRDKFGLEVRPSFNPIGAADYILSNNIKGRCFSDYLTSSYLLWKIPGFETFIDLRDLDVFPSDFFNTFTEAVMVPEKFMALDAKYKFDYAVLYRPQFGGLHKYLSQGNGYRLVYVDAVAAVYLKTNDTTLGYTADVFRPLPVTSPSSCAWAVTKIFNPLYESPAADIEGEETAAANYFIGLGEPEKAIFHIQQILTGDYAYKGNELMGQVYYNKSMTGPQDSIPVTLQSAAMYFSKSLQQKPDYVPALMGLGAVYFQQQYLSQAKTAFEKVTNLEPGNVNAWLSLAGCYKATIQQQGAIQEAIRCMAKADNLNPNNPIVQFELGVLYYRSGDCKNCIERMSKVNGFSGLSPQEQETVQTCLKGCGAL